MDSTPNVDGEVGWLFFFLKEDSFGFHVTFSVGIPKSSWENMKIFGCSQFWLPCRDCRIVPFSCMLLGPLFRLRLLLSSSSSSLSSSSQKAFFSSHWLGKHPNLYYNLFKWSQAMWIHKKDSSKDRTLQGSERFGLVDWWRCLERQITILIHPEILRKRWYWTVRPRKRIHTNYGEDIEYSGYSDIIFFPDWKKSIFGSCHVFSHFIGYKHWFPNITSLILEGQTAEGRVGPQLRAQQKIFHQPTGPPARKGLGFLQSPWDEDKNYLKKNCYWYLVVSFRWYLFGVAWCNLRSTKKSGAVFKTTHWDMIRGAVFFFAEVFFRVFMRKQTQVIWSQKMRRVKLHIL